MWQALWHNVIWVCIGTISPIVLGLLLGVSLWMGVKGRLIFRTVYFLPVILSEVVIAIIWNWIYHPLFGAVNQLLDLIGLGSCHAVGWAIRLGLCMPCWERQSGPITVSVL